MHVELHILQSFAPSCLNRDDTNTPKDCTFGGVRRARLSSQALKRAIRTSPVFRERVGPGIGVRTKLLVDEVVRVLVSAGRDADQAQLRAAAALSAAGYQVDGNKSKVLLFLSPGEIANYARVVDTHWETLGELVAASASEEGAEKGKAKAKSKGEKGGGGPKPPKEMLDALKAFGSSTCEAADIALFGRMVAENTNMNITAACQVAHALSTHEVRPEADFFTAVDDLQPREETGAGMMGTIEFNSACYYRYASVDLGQLAATLGGDAGQASKIALAFLEAAIHARPSARQATMAAHNPPSYVLVRVREHGAPCALTNAFVKPTRPGRDLDLTEASIRALEDYEQRLDGMYGTDGVRLTVRASTYAQPAGGSVGDLLARVAQALA